MSTTSTQESHQQLSYSKKVWIAVGIVSLVVIILLLFKTLFSLVLLTLAGVLLAVYFHGFAGLLHKHIHTSYKLSLAIGIILNIILLVGFFWFVGARLQQQISVLSQTLPSTIENAKTQMSQSAIGSKVLNYLQTSGNSQKTMSVARRFFSSSFGILSDLYIVLLIGIFFTAGPSLYKKGMVHLLPPGSKDEGYAMLNEISGILKKWLKGQIFGFFFITVLSGIGLWIIGMPLVLTLALIAGLLNLIPNFGPIIALIPAELLALTKGTTTAIIIVCMYTGIQIIQSAVTQPLIQKKMISIPPALVIMGQVAMGALGGFWGVLLATPVVGIIMTVVKKLYINKQSHHKFKVEATA